MPMLPNTNDVDSKAVDPSNAILPEAEGINRIEREVEAPNYVEKKPDIVAEVTPPSNFVSNKLNQFGESTNNARKIDVEFEQYVAGREKQIQPKERQKQIEADKNRFISISDNIFNKEVDQLKGMDSTRKQALYGVADFAQEAANTAVEFRNTARRLFNMSESESVPDYASMLPEPKTPQEEFVRSSTKFLTGMLPISKTFKAVTGVAGVANSLASSGIYGFLFDDNQTEGLVNNLIQENFDIAPDILDYMNHKTDDSKFITRLKNSANYVADDLAFEGIFQGLKMARSLSKGRSQAYKVLENGDVEVKGKDVTGKKPVKQNKSLLETVMPESLPKVSGLTTEDIGKKTFKDTIEEEIAAARAEIKTKYELKQDANPERSTRGRAKALAEIEKNPMSLKQLLNMPENTPVNDVIVMQAEIAQNALGRLSKRIGDNVNLGKEDPQIALYKLKNISEAMDKLSFPRSTSGGALESAKFTSNMDQVDKLDMDILDKQKKIFGTDAKMIFDEYKLAKDNLAGFPFIDSVLQGMRKTVDPKKMRQYVTTARINWILSDPTIHTTNVSSNTMTMGLRSATELTAAGVTKARSMLGNKYLAKGVAFNEANATVNGYMTGLSKGFKIIADNIAIAAKNKTLSSPDFRAIYSRDSNTKYNMAIDKIIAESDAANNFENATLGKQIVQVLGHTVAGTPVGKMLSWEDDFFKGMHYMAEVNKQLTIDENNIARNASTYPDAAEAQAYTAKEMARVNNIRENFKKGILDENIDKQARDAANYWTFNSELVGDDAITNLLKAGEVGRNQSEILRWFIPFYRTGANIANMSLEYTPVIGGILKMKNVGGVAKLISGGREADTFIAKQVIGSTVMATAATLYMQLEDTFGIDFQMSSLKNNKVGIKIGDVEFGVDKQNPTLKLFIATRDIMDIANIAQQAEGASSAAMSAAALFMEMYSPEQMIQTLGTLSDITSGPAKDIPSKIENMLKTNVLSQVTPYSGLARFANRDVKGMNKVNMGQERGEDLIDEMMKRFTHLYLGDDANIPVRRGIFGQEIPYLRTLGYSVSDNAHDMLAGYDLNEPVVKEIFRLTREDVMTNPNNYDSFELNNTTILKMPTRSITLPTGESYELTPREYSDYVKISAGDHPSFNGRTLKSTLEGYVQTEGYQKLPDAFKTTAIKDIVNLYRKAAKGILLKDNVDIMIEGREALIRLKKEYMNVK